MDKLIIKGSPDLSESISIKGSKNSTLPIMVSSLLSKKSLNENYLPPRNRWPSSNCCWSCYFLSYPNFACVIIEDFETLTILFGEKYDIIAHKDTTTFVKNPMANTSRLLL